MADRGAWGQYNMVADRLSRYHSSDLPGEKHVDHQCVSADLRLDPDGEDPPYGLTRALQTQESPESDPNLVPTWEEHQGQTTLGNSRLPESLSHMMMSTDGFLESVRAGYAEDPLFTKVIENPGRFNQFQWQDGLLYLDRVEGLPAHRTISHTGNEHTNKCIRKFYWWNTLSKNVAKFCLTCGTCQAVEPSTQRPMGLLHPLPIPSQPWESIGICITAAANPTAGPLDHLVASLGVLEWEGEHLLRPNPLLRARKVPPIESYAFASRTESLSVGLWKWRTTCSKGSSATSGNRCAMTTNWLGNTPPPHHAILTTLTDLDPWQRGSTEYRSNDPYASQLMTVAERPSGRTPPCHPRLWFAQSTSIRDSSLSGPIFKMGGTGGPDIL